MLQGSVYWQTFHLDIYDVFDMLSFLLTIIRDCFQKETLLLFDDSACVNVVYIYIYRYIYVYPCLCLVTFLSCCTYFRIYYPRTRQRNNGLVFISLVCKTFSFEQSLGNSLYHVNFFLLILILFLLKKIVFMEFCKHVFGCKLMLSQTFDVQNIIK